MQAARERTRYQAAREGHLNLVSYEPRAFQSETLTRLAELRREGEQRALVVMASGLGKTVLAAHDIARFEMEIDRKATVLYLSHQAVILNQAYRTLEAILGDDRDYGRFDSEERRVDADVTFATFQSMSRHLERFDPAGFDYIVVDEAHHTAAPTRDAVVGYFGSLFRLGLTATPRRGDGLDILEYYGDTIAAWLPLEAALAQGLLTPIDYRVVTDMIDTAALDRALRSAGRLGGGGFFRHQNDRAIVDKVLEAAEGIEGKRRILVFCASIDQLEHFTPLFPGAQAITGQDSRDYQIATVDAFREGDFEILLSRDVLNEGIDIPDASMIVFLRNTESPVVFLQQLGRGLRKAPGKDSVLVLDFVDNVERLEFVCQMMAGIERAAKRISKAPTVPRSALTLDDAAREMIERITLKRVKAGYFTSLVGLSEAFDGKISVETLRRISAETDALAPDAVLAALDPRTLYFDPMNVMRLMRMVHSPRVPTHLVSSRQVASKIGQPFTWVRRKQESGYLPAAWFQVQPQGIETFYDRDDVERMRESLRPLTATAVQPKRERS